MVENSQHLGFGGKGVHVEASCCRQLNDSRERMLLNFKEGKMFVAQSELLLKC